MESIFVEVAKCCAKPYCPFGERRFFVSVGECGRFFQEKERHRLKLRGELLANHSGKL